MMELTLELTNMSGDKFLYEWRGQGLTQFDDGCGFKVQVGFSPEEIRYVCKEPLSTIRAMLDWLAAHPDKATVGVEDLETHGEYKCRNCGQSFIAGCCTHPAKWAEPKPDTPALVDEEGGEG